MDDSSSNPVSITVNEPPEKVIQNNITTRSIFEKKVLLAFKSSKPTDTVLHLMASGKVLSNLLNLQLNQMQSGDFSDSINQPIINHNIIEKLRRLSLRNQLQVQIQLGKLYEILLREKYQPILLQAEVKILIEVSNEIFGILGKIKGNKAYHLLRIGFYSFLLLLLSVNGLNNEQKESIQEELKLFTYINNRPVIDKGNDYSGEGININFNDVVDDSYNQSKNNLLYHQLLDSLSSMEHIEEGYQLMSLFGYDLFKSMLYNPQSTKYLLYSNLGKILINYLISPQYKLISNSSQLQKQSLIISNEKENSSKAFDDYLDKDYEIDLHFKLIGDLFEVCYLFLSSTVTVLTINELSDIFFIIMKRLYFTFHSRRNDLAALVIRFYSINHMSPFPKKYQSFLKHLLASSAAEDSVVKKELLKLYPQFNDFNGTPQDDIQTEEINIVSLSRIGFGYNCRCAIEAGNQWSVLIEIDKAMCLLYLWMRIELNDISVLIEKYSNDKGDKAEGEEWSLMKKFDRVKLKLDNEGESGYENFQLIFLLKETGIYRVVFDNSYSWFKAKELMYKMILLKPINCNSICFGKSNERRERYHLIDLKSNLGLTPLSQIKDNLIQSELNSIIIALLYDRINSTIRMLNPNTHQAELLIELKKTEKLTLQMMLHSVFLKYYSFYNSLSVFKDKTIVLNCFIMESSLTQAIAIDSNNLFSDNEKDNENDSNAQHRNITINYLNFANSCLNYSLYQKSIQYAKNNSILHLHLTSACFYPSLHLAYDSAHLYNQISLLKYPNEIHSIISFLKELHHFLKSFEVHLTYTEADLSFVLKLKETIQANITDIEGIFIYDYVYLNEVLNTTHILC